MLGPAIAAIRSKLEAEAPLPAADLAWYREPFTRPDPPRPWALVRIVGGPAALQTLAPKGSGRAAQLGAVQVFVHTPQGSGQQVATDIADGFAAVLQRQDFGARVLTDDARVDEGEDIVKDLADSYDVTLVSVPFEFHHAL